MAWRVSPSWRTLGDVVQNGLASEIEAAKDPFGILVQNKIPFSVIAGNHDLPSSRTDDQRGPTPFLDGIAPLAGRQRIARDAGGYNSAYTFDGAGTQFLLLALDWRLSAAGVAWARSVLEANPETPTIITVHDAVTADSGAAVLSEHGQLVWDNLIKDHKQVFLSLNGHFWPTGRLTQPNAEGQPVELHLANYQQHYYGGAAAVRLYRFDLERGVVDVSTEVPYAGLHGLNELEREELQITAETDRFSFALPPVLRAPVRRAPRTAESIVIAGTEAYWRFEEPWGSGFGFPGGRRLGPREHARRHRTVEHPADVRRRQPPFPAGVFAGFHRDQGNGRLSAHHRFRADQQQRVRRRQHLRGVLPAA